jgi:murein tripeptide amidase MpaA
MRVIALVLVLAALVSAEQSEPVVRFDGHKVLRLTLQPHQLLLAAGLDAVLPNMDWWKEAAVFSNGPSFSDIRVEPEQMAEVVRLLDSHKIEWRVMIDDVQAVADAQLLPASSDAADWHTAYHDYNATAAWLNDLANQYKSIASLVIIGRTTQGRNMWGLRITGQGTQKKPQIFLDGGIHAREWISPAVIDFHITKLLEGYGKDAAITKLVDAIEWTLVPIFNADGYSFTWTNNRMWRKTRSTNAGSACIGTDPCRNAAAGWGGPGASTDPCSDTYRGKAAFSEPEVKAISDYVKKLGNVKYYNNFHSYSQLWLSPWGYTNQLPPQPDYGIQQTLGQLAVAEIKKVHGLTYTQGPVYTTIYPASGILCDEIYKSSGVVASYTCELRDTGASGFLLPPAQIKPTGEEIWASTVAIANYILAHPEQFPENKISA